jgi:hypothetical protein
MQARLGIRRRTRLRRIRGGGKKKVQLAPEGHLAEIFPSSTWARRPQSAELVASVVRLPSRSGRLAGQPAAG